MARRSQKYIYLNLNAKKKLLIILIEELQTWGWHEFYIQPAYADMKFWQVESVVEALGINGKPKSEGGNIIPYDVQHWDPDMKDESGRLIDKKDQKYKVDGKEYRVGSFSPVIVIPQSARMTNYSIGYRSATCLCHKSSRWW